jgi:ComF family protein
MQHARPVAGIERYLCLKCLLSFGRGEKPNDEHLREQLKQFFPIEESASLLTYRPFEQEGLIQSVIHTFKYGDMPRLARKLGAMLGHEWMMHKTEFDILIPVPLHRTRLAERGYNQSEEIARGLSKVWKLQVASERTIRRIRPTKSQAKLSIPERVENVQGAFRLGQRSAEVLRDKRILIVDDVVTTGSTIGSVANEVTLSHPRLISFLIFASAVRPIDLM